MMPQKTISLKVEPSRSVKEILTHFNFSGVKYDKCTVGDYSKLIIMKTYLNV